jgi:hypothetical protein
MGLIHTRSRRDECGARASTLQSVRYLMLGHLSEETRKIPEVAELLEILHEVERSYWDDLTRADRQLQSEVSSARDRLRI